MVDISRFDEIFSLDPEYTYPGKTNDEIVFHRGSLGGKLFFDRLLELLHIDRGQPEHHLVLISNAKSDQATKRYPPRSNADLRRLWEKIVSSTRPDHHKQSLLYYILLDCQDEVAAAEEFVDQCHLPEKYITFMKGLWLMDRMQFEVRLLLYNQTRDVNNLIEAFQTALEFLTEPSLLPTFAEEILLTLARHAPDNDPSLALAYYHTISPVLTSLRPLEALFFVMCQASVTEAFYFSRRQAESTQKQLLEQLISYVLSYTRGEDRAAKSLELVNLPFSQQEEDWFEEYLGAGEGKMLHGAKDTVTMRRIGTGRFREALADVNGPNGRKIDGVNWEALRLGLAAGLASRSVEERWPTG